MKRKTDAAGIDRKITVYIYNITEPTIQQLRYQILSKYLDCCFYCVKTLQHRASKQKARAKKKRNSEIVQNS